MLVCLLVRKFAYKYHITLKDCSYTQNKQPAHLWPLNLFENIQNKVISQIPSKKFLFCHYFCFIFYIILHLLKLLNFYLSLLKQTFYIKKLLFLIAIFKVIKTRILKVCDIKTINSKFNNQKNINIGYKSKNFNYQIF